MRDRVQTARKVLHSHVHADGDVSFSILVAYILKSFYALLFIGRGKEAQPPSSCLPELFSS
jgi:hypothetical protein